MTRSIIGYISNFFKSKVSIIKDEHNVKKKSLLKLQDFNIENDEENYAGLTEGDLIKILPRKFTKNRENFGLSINTEKDTVGKF